MVARYRYQLLFSIALLKPILAAPQATSSERIEPVVVEAPREKATAITTQVPIESVDAPKLSNGMLLDSMEHTDLLSLHRPSFLLWDEKSSEAVAAHANLSLDQTLMVGARHHVGPWRLQEMVGMATDRRLLRFRFNNNTPDIAEDDKTVSLSADSERFFGSIGGHTDRWEISADVDTSSQHILAQSQDRGRQLDQQVLVQSGYRAPLYGVSLAGLAHHGQTVSTVADMVSSHERGGVFAASGFGTLWKGARAELSFQSELLNRQDLSGVDADFQRHRITPKFEQRWEFPIVELAAIGSGSVFVQDAFGLNETYGLWEAELSATTPKIWGQGVRASARRYSQAPRAEEIFGDGALLLPSQELRPRDGLYVAAGPWLEREHWSLGTELFYDRSRNEPLFVSSNPGAARALNLGGSVASGVHAQSGITYARVQWTGEYEFRHAVNDTDIDWQRGQPIPGVPAHKAGSTLTFTWLPFSWGGTYTYVSRRAIDLVGQWWQGDQHQLGVFVERRAQTWVARAEGNQLLPVKEAPELNSGAAGPTLLNQGVRGWEARIIVEFLL